KSATATSAGSATSIRVFGATTVTRLNTVVPVATAVPLRVITRTVRSTHYSPHPCGLPQVWANRHGHVDAALSMAGPKPPGWAVRANLCPIGCCSGPCRRGGLRGPFGEHAAVQAHAQAGRAATAGR